MLEIRGGRRGDRPPGDVAQKAGAEEDGEDGEVLFRMFDGEVAVSGTERILNACAEVVRKRHHNELQLGKEKDE